jgi:hypothetical protein
VPPKWRLFAVFSRIQIILPSSVRITTSVTYPIYQMTSDWNGK